MSGIRATTPADFLFRQADTPATRAQKLELLRTRVARPEEFGLSIVGLAAAPVAAPLFIHRVRDTSWTFAAGSYADAEIGATGTPALRIRKNGVQVGTISFTGTVGTVSALPGLVKDDLFEIYPPAAADATLDQLSASLFVTIV